jgi:hypothetical protein
MSTVELFPFTSNAVTSVTQFMAHISLLEGGMLLCHYVVDMPVEDIILPEDVAAERADGLWKTSCFELFLREKGSTDYLELNFSPDTRWAAYSFTGYRKGMDALDLPIEPEIFAEIVDDNRLMLEAELELPDEWQDKELEANITAVLQMADGQMEYWATAHPQEKPDFHDPACFIVTLTPEELE